MWVYSSHAVDNHRAAYAKEWESLPLSNITNADRPFGSRRIRRALSVGALAFGATMLSVALPVAGSSFLTPGISTAQAQTPMTITGRVPVSYTHLTLPTKRIV